MHNAEGLKKGVLLINLGTPDSYNPKSVKQYLKEFLNDERVIDLPSWFRYPFVNWFIIPRRYKTTSEAYRKIWLTNGSPLLQHGLMLTESLADKLGEKFQVELAMRYGNPSIPDTLKKMMACESIQVIPLFPQYSSAANGSAIEKFIHEIKGKWNIPHLKITNAFYDHPKFIEAFSDRIRSILPSNFATDGSDYLLFSYHGLPERHINKSECKAQCDRVNACPSIKQNNWYCYRAQCFKTTALIAEQLNLNPIQFTSSFQSRLGRTPWIKPYTDVLLPELIAKGVKNLYVACPSFVSDCLETLEEVDIRTREQWMKLGGKDFVYIPCINSHKAWVDGLVEMVQD